MHVWRHQTEMSAFVLLLLFCLKKSTCVHVHVAAAVSAGTVHVCGTCMVDVLRRLYSDTAYMYYRV